MSNTDLGSYFFHQGTNYRAYEYLGCTLNMKDGKYEYTFRTWAPNAKSVGLISEFSGWNKAVPFDEGEYRLHGMEKNSADEILFDRYCILELEKDGETYGLYFPCYEINVIKELVGEFVETY